MEIVPQQQGLKVYLRPRIRELSARRLELFDCEHVGHWTNGNSFLLLERSEDVPEGIELIRQAIALECK